MRTSQTLMLEMSEKRSELATVTEKLNSCASTDTEPSTEDIGRASALTTEIRHMEVRYRAAVLAEEQEDRDAADGAPSGDRTKFLELEQRCSVTAFMREALSDKRLEGAEAEYRQEVLGEGAEAGLMPVRMLGDRTLPDTEQRAVTPVAAEAVGMGSQADILPRVFTRSIASSLGVAMPSVPMGTRTFPVMLTGSTASMQAKGGKQEAEAGSFGGFTLSPRRLTGSYEVGVEDLQLLRGLEDSLRRDLRATLQDRMDDQIVNGDGNAPNVAGFLSELPAPAAAGARANFARYIAAFTGLIDGLNAYGISELRAVFGTKVYSDMEAAYRGQNTEHTAYSELMRRGVGLRVSSRMPGVTAKNAPILAALTGYPGTNAVAPIWEGVQLIRDIYTQAQEGQVRLTMLMLWNFKIVREAGWKLFNVQAVD